MQTWDYLLKQMLWKQLDFVQCMRILDFGSGTGDTAARLGICNDVTAVEPSVDMLTQRTQGDYTQLQGGIELVRDMPAASFDLVLCHNVLEYVDEKEAYLHELARLVKPGGYISLVKHNRPGRVMQMAVCSTILTWPTRCWTAAMAQQPTSAISVIMRMRTHCGGCRASHAKNAGAPEPSGICSKSRSAKRMLHGSRACWRWRNGYLRSHNIRI